MNALVLHQEIITILKYIFNKSRAIQKQNSEIFMFTIEIFIQKQIIHSKKTTILFCQTWNKNAEIWTVVKYFNLFLTQKNCQ